MHRAVPLLAVVVVAALAGCGALFGDDGDTSGPAVAEKVDRELGDVDTLQMTMTWRIESGDNDPVRYVADVAFRSPNRLNMTYREPGRYAGTRLVGNGTNLTVTNPNNGKYASLPVVNNGTGISSLFLGLTDVENPEFVGNETVGGEGAVKLEYAVSGSEVSLFLAGGVDTSRISENEDEANVTVWVDREQWVPRKATINMTGFETTVNMSLSYENVAVDESIPDSRFETTPGASVNEEVDTMWEVLLPSGSVGYDAQEELAADLGSAAPPAELPDGYAFNQGFSLPLSADGEERRYRLFYNNSTRPLEVHHVTEPVGILDGSESMTVDDRRVNVSVASGTTITHYQCDESAYSVLGRVPAEDLRPAIRAIGCPA